MTVSYSFSVQAWPTPAQGWSELARRCEELGFHGLLVPDHPGSVPSPFVALSAAASVTDRLRLGTCVANAGLWDPVPLACEVATLDLVSGGRALLGLGAGHTPAEWEMQARVMPPAPDRVQRLIEVADTTRQLLAGETVTFAGRHIVLRDATLEQPRPVQHPVPLLIGGNGPRVLRYGGEHADIVSLTGLARTLEDGHRHEVAWSRADIDRTVELVHMAADAAGSRPQLEALVQHLEITDDAEAVAGKLAQRVPGAATDDILQAPYVLLGTVEELVTELRRHHDRWGITRYVVRENALEDARHLLSAEPHSRQRRGIPLDERWQ